MHLPERMSALRYAKCYDICESIGHPEKCREYKFTRSASYRRDSAAHRSVKSARNFWYREMGWCSKALQLFAGISGRSENISDLYHPHEEHREALSNELNIQSQSQLHGRKRDVQLSGH